MSQKKGRESMQSRDFPIVTVLICMGVFTVVASVGLFAWISNRAVVSWEPDAALVQPVLENVQNAEPAAPTAVVTDSNSANKIAPEQPVAALDNQVEQPQVDDQTDEATDDTPQMSALNQADSIGIAPGEMAKWKSMLGLTATLEGVVIKPGESSSGKTRYLWFSNDRDNSAMVFMFTRKIGDDLSLKYLDSLNGKKIRVTGTVEEQFGTKRVGVRIQNQSQIEIVE